MDLETYRLNETPERVYYIPEFISEAEERTLIEQINNAPKPKWTQLSHRRLQNWGGLPHPKGMIAETLPEWLSKYVNKVGELNVFGGLKPNHVLINEYQPGQGIMPHLDGLLFHPTVTTISCGSHTLLDFYHPRQETSEELKKENNITDCSSNNDPMLSLLLEPRSLVILQAEMYQHFLHGIADRHCDQILSSKLANLNNCSKRFSEDQFIERSTRLSLTIRHVPNTKKFPAWFK